MYVHIISSLIYLHSLFFILIIRESEGQRERDRERDIYMYVYIYVYIYMCTYEETNKAINRQAQVCSERELPSLCQGSAALGPACAPECRGRGRGRPGGDSRLTKAGLKGEFKIGHPSRHKHKIHHNCSSYTYTYT